jgi:hypothetical protein
LFEAVFRQAFEKFAPHINEVFNSERSVFEKIKKFTNSYISFVMENPYLPNFLIQEINNNPEFSQLFFGSHIAPNPLKFEKQIAEDIEMGIIKPIDPKQLLLNLFSLTAFSFVGTGLVRGILNLDDKKFKAMMQERKVLIPELLINSIKK